MANEKAERSGSNGGDNTVVGKTPPKAKGNTATITPQATPADSAPARSPTIDGVGSSPSGGGSGHGSSHGSSASHLVTGPVQDLLAENLLLGAPRTTFEGKQCPALGGIPLLRKLGQGGMGAVYYGVHPRLNIEVAVKVLPYHLVEKDPLLVERFFREAQISAQVRSPHLVNVMDVNEESGVFFLVMEYVNGMSGKDRLAQAVRSGEQGLSERETLEICIAATMGLDDAHARGIIHRDIKPENIMIPNISKTSTDLDVTAAKLMDLGLARADSGTIGNAALTATKQAMGTPGYMAPEQIMDARTAGPRSDVFSMGATIYGMLAGAAPFKRKNSMQTLMATMNAPHVPLSEARPGVSEATSHVVDICLAKDQADRYPDGHTLLLELKECLARLADGPAGMPRSGAQAERSQMTEGQELPALVDASPPPEEAVAPPPRKRSPVLLYITGAAVVLLSIGVGFLLKGRGGDSPEKLHTHEIMIKGIMRDLSKNQIESALDMATDLAGLKVSDANARQREAAVLGLVRAQEALKRDDANLVEIDQLIGAAEDKLEDKNTVAVVRDRYHQKKRSMQETAAAGVDADAIDALVRAGEFAKAAEKLDATEKKFADNDRVKRSRKEFTEKKTAYDTAKANRITAAENMLSDTKSDLADISRKIEDLETLYGKDSRIAALRTGFEGRKAATRKAAIETAEALLKSDLAEAERQVAQLEQKYPKDTEVAAIRTKLAARKTEASETARVKRITPALDDFKNAFVTAEPNLKLARIALEEAEKLGATKAELAPLVAQLADGTARVERNLDFNLVRDSIANKVADFDVAERDLKNLEKKYVNDAGLAALREALTKRKNEVASAQETERRNHVRIPLSALDKLLADRNSDLKEAESKLADAQKAKATADELAPYKRKLDEERAYRSDYAKAFGDIEKLFADKASNSGDLEKQFSALKATYPGDAKLKDISTRIDERKQSEKLAAETARKKRVAPLIEAAEAALGATSVDFAAVQKKLNEAEAAGATADELKPVQSKLSATEGQFAERQRAIKSVEEAIADVTDDPAIADKKLADLIAKHRGAPGVEALQAKLAEKKKTIADAKETRRKGEIKALLDDVDAILTANNSVLDDGRKKLNLAQSLGAPTADVDSRRAKIAAEDDRRIITSRIKNIDDIVADSSGDLATADNLLSKLEQKYPNNVNIKDARKRYDDRKKGDLAAVEAAKKKRAEEERVEKERIDKQNREKFDSFANEARTHLTAKDLARAGASIRSAESLAVADPKLASDPKLAAVKTDYDKAVAAKKIADDEAAAKLKADAEVAAKKKAADEEVARAAAKKKADEDEVLRVAAARKKAEEDAITAAKLKADADLAAAKKRAADEEAARIAATKKKPDEVSTKKPVTPTQPEKKRRRIGEEDVE